MLCWNNNWEELKDNPGLEQMMNMLGKVVWDGVVNTRFERDTSQLQEIRLV